MAELIAHTLLYSSPPFLPTIHREYIAGMAAALGSCF
jgi:hypothetical protein